MLIVRRQIKHKAGVARKNEATSGWQEWPFLSGACGLPFEPGMMIAYEGPLCLDGVRGFIIADQPPVNETGIEILSRLPRTLVQRG